MALASSTVLVVEWVPQNGYYQCLCPQDESQLSSSSLGGSLRSASESDSSFFQITLLPWVLECMRFCVHRLTVESLSHSPDSPEISPTDLQSQRFWGLIFPVQNLADGEPHEGLVPLAPWGEPLQLELSSHLWVTCPGVLLVPCLRSSYPSYCISFFISLVVEDFFLLIFLLFISIIAL